MKIVRKFLCVVFCFLCFCMTSSKAIVPNKDIVKNVLAMVDHPPLFIPIELIDNYEFNSSLFSDSDFNNAVRIWVSVSKNRASNRLPRANEKILNVIFNEQSKCRTEDEAFDRTSAIINDFLSQIGWRR